MTKSTTKTVISYLNPNELLINKSRLLVSTCMLMPLRLSCIYQSRCGKRPITLWLLSIIETFPFNREEIYAAGFGKKSLADATGLPEQTFGRYARPKSRHLHP